MKICFFTKHEISWGSSKERIGLYLSELQREGHKLTLISLVPNILSHLWIGNRWAPRIYVRLISFWYQYVVKIIKGLNLIFQASRFDLIVIQKINLPQWLLITLQKRNPNIIFDVDDLCFHPKMLTYFRLVIVGNEYLAQIAQQTLPPSRVAILPTAIDCALFFPDPHKPKTPIINIGWAGSGENHFEYLKLLVKPLEIIAQRYPIMVQIVGSTKKIKTLFQSSHYKIQHTDWLSTHDLAKTIRSFDIGVMPLIQNSFSEGKCGFKALIYMASGVAAIVSPIGINKKIIQNGVNGYWAVTEKEWIHTLESLITQESVRQRFVQEGRKTVETFYSLEKNTKKFIHLIGAHEKGPDTRCPRSGD